MPVKTTLLRGDCLHLLPSLSDGSVDLVCADLPYAHVVGRRVRKCTANKWDKPIDLAALWVELLRVGKRNAAFVFTATFDFAVALRNSQPKLGLCDIAWRKGQATGHLNARRQPLRVHEYILTFYRAQPTYNPQMWLAGKPGHNPKGACRTAKNFSTSYGNQRVSEIRYSLDRFPLSILDVRSTDRSLHPTQKPLALLEWLIRTYSNPGDTVLDPCFGSGTTGHACINTGRSFVGMELDPSYFDTASQRIADAHSAVSRETSQGATPRGPACLS